MRIQELGNEIRRARRARRLTQAQLAAKSGLSRTTLSQLENGLFPDLGVKKVQAILDCLGLELSVQDASQVTRPDYIRMACATASVSFRDALTEEELIKALLSGRVPPGKRPQFRALLEEAVPGLLVGLRNEANRWTKPGKVEENLRKIADAVGLSGRIDHWLKTT